MLPYCTVIKQPHVRGSPAPFARETTQADRARTDLNSLSSGIGEKFKGSHFTLFKRSVESIWSDDDDNIIILQQRIRRQ